LAELKALKTKSQLTEDSDSTADDDSLASPRPQPVRTHRRLRYQRQKKNIPQPETNNETSKEMLGILVFKIWNLQPSPFSGLSLPMCVKQFSHYLKDAYLSSFSTKKIALREFVTGFITELNKASAVELNYPLIDEIIATEDLKWLFHVPREDRQVENCVKDIVECYINTVHILSPIKILNEDLFSCKSHSCQVLSECSKTNPDIVYTRSVDTPFLYESPTIDLSLRKFLHEWKQDPELDFVDGIRTLLQGFLVELKKVAMIEEDDQLLDEILVSTDYTNLLLMYRLWKQGRFGELSPLTYLMKEIITSYLEALNAAKQIVVLDRSRFKTMTYQALGKLTVAVKYADDDDIDAATTSEFLGMGIF
jgi:hypothetical protein